MFYSPDDSVVNFRSLSILDANAETFSFDSSSFCDRTELKGNPYAYVNRINCLLKSGRLKIG